MADEIPANSRYQPDYPERIISWAEQHPGQGLLGWCKEVRISRFTLADWKGKYKDFQDAVEVAETIIGAEYERLNLLAANGEGVGKYAPNGQALKFGLKQHAGWNTSDTADVNASFTVLLEKDAEDLG